MLAQSYDPGMIENTFFKIYITHLATKQTIDFRGWVTDFSDQFTSNWTPESVYGRMDPLATFQNTQRRIAMGFDVVSGDAAQAVENLGKINSLISFLYPVYESGQRGIQNTLKAAPLIGLRWTNLVADVNDGSQLVGYLGGANYSPDLNQGGFITGQRYERTNDGERPAELDTGVSTETKMVDFTTTTNGSEMNFVPKVVSLSLDFTVLHKHLTGWSKKGRGYTFGPEAAMFPNASSVIVPGSRADQTTTYEQGDSPADLTGNPRDPIASSANDEVLGVPPENN